MSVMVQAEIAGLGGGGPETSVTEDSSAQEDHSKELAELSSHLEGSKVRAPFSKDWGQMEYHNAIVLSIEAVGIAHVDDIKVNVSSYCPGKSSLCSVGASLCLNTCLCVWRARVIVSVRQCSESYIGCCGMLLQMLLCLLANHSTSDLFFIMPVVYTRAV